MRLGRKIDDGIHAVADCGAHGLRIADVALEEMVARLAFHVAQVGGIAGIGDCVQVDDLEVRPFAQRDANEMRADEA